MRGSGRGAVLGAEDEGLGQGALGAWAAVLSSGKPSKAQAIGASAVVAFEDFFHDK